MSFMLLHRLLYLTVIISTAVNLVIGDKFIGKYLRNKVRNYMLSAQNDTNHKLWMKYLEKRLEILSMYTNVHTFRKTQISSIVQFYKRNLQKEYFWKMYGSCTKENGEVQSDIFGTICASSKDGENVPQPDTCAQIPWPKMKKHCY